MKGYRLRLDIPKATRLRTRKTPRRRVSTSTNRSHGVGLVSSLLLVLLGLASIGVGVYAWTQARLPVVAVEQGVPVTLARSPIFDPGTTLFARGDGTELAEPTAWGCSLTRGDVMTELLVKPDFDSVGSRVRNSSPYQPVVTVGPSEPGDQVRCDGPIVQRVDLLAMPTDVGVRAVPLAFVVAGIGLLGLSGLVHPRGRGINRFGT